MSLMISQLYSDSLSDLPPPKQKIVRLAILTNLLLLQIAPAMQLILLILVSDPPSSAYIGSHLVYYALQVLLSAFQIILAPRFARGHDWAGLAMYAGATGYLVYLGIEMMSISTHPAYPGALLNLLSIVDQPRRQVLVGVAYGLWISSFSIYSYMLVKMYSLFSESSSISSSNSSLTSSAVSTRAQEDSASKFSENPRPWKTNISKV